MRRQADAVLKARMMLFINPAVNAAYALFNACGGIILRSAWMGTLAFYYIALSAARFFLIRGYRRGGTRKRWKAYRLSAVLMLLLTVALLGIFCLTVIGGRQIIYHEYIIYAIAAYTFYSVIAALRNVVVFRRYNDPILSASKAISLAVAAISVYSLQNAMISAFGDDEKFKLVMSICVGAGVFALIVGISVKMLITAHKKLKTP